jgi:hypothetical protein
MTLERTEANLEASLDPIIAEGIQTALARHNVRHNQEGHGAK